MLEDSQCLGWRMVHVWVGGWSMFEFHVREDPLDLRGVAGEATDAVG